MVTQGVDRGVNNYRDSGSPPQTVLWFFFLRSRILPKRDFPSPFVFFLQTFIKKFLSHAIFPLLVLYFTIGFTMMSWLRPRVEIMHLLFSFHHISRVCRCWVYTTPSLELRSSLPPGRPLGRAFPDGHRSSGNKGLGSRLTRCGVHAYGQFKYRSLPSLCPKKRLIHLWCCKGKGGWEKGGLLREKRRASGVAMVRKRVERRPGTMVGVSGDIVLMISHIVKVKASYLTSVAKQAKTAFLHGPTV